MTLPIIKHLVSSRRGGGTYVLNTTTNPGRITWTLPSNTSNTTYYQPGDPVHLQPAGTALIAAARCAAYDSLLLS